MMNSSQVVQTRRHIFTSLGSRRRRQEAKNWRPPPFASNLLTRSSLRSIWERKRCRILQMTTIRYSDIQILIKSQFQVVIESKFYPAVSLLRFCTAESLILLPCMLFTNCWIHSTTCRVCSSWAVSTSTTSSYVVLLEPLTSVQENNNISNIKSKLVFKKSEQIGFLFKEYLLLKNTESSVPDLKLKLKLKLYPDHWALFIDRNDCCNSAETNFMSIYFIESP